MWSSRTPFGNTPPEKFHVNLPAESLLPGRVIVVGDIHGCLAEFNQLLDSCSFNPERDNLILAGDIINKGPNSVDVLRKARQLNARVIRGNHEDACLALRKRFKVVSTLSSSYKWLKQLDEDDMDYLQKLPFTITLPSHKVVVVHAGFVPDGTPIDQQTMKNMLFLEDVDTEEGKENKFKCHYKTKAENKSWARFWKGPYHVLFGHASGRAVQRYPCATGLDTGCCSGGSLTACILPSAAELERIPEFQAYLQDAASARGPTLSELHATFVHVATRVKPGLVTAASEDLCCSSLALTSSLGTHSSGVSSMGSVKTFSSMGSVQTTNSMGSVQTVNSMGSLQPMSSTTSVQPMISVGVLQPMSSTTLPASNGSAATLQCGSSAP